MSRRRLLGFTAVLAVLGLAGCGGPAATEASGGGARSSESPGAADSGAPDGHGAIAGAAETAEAPLALLSVDAAGSVGLLDLLDGTTSTLGTIDAPGTSGAGATPIALVSDGRYAFVSTATGLAIADSGRWTWDHVDHFHYYRAEPRLLGTVPGSGVATVTTGPLSTAGGTGLFFGASGEAVLLDNRALSEGRVEERFRLGTGADHGLLAPLGDGALLGVDGELTALNRDGAPLDARIACTDPAGAIVTRVGLAVSCAEGAVLAVADGEDPVLELIPTPAGAPAERARDFEGRKGRPTVAALAGGDSPAGSGSGAASGASTPAGGFWLLDTRARALTHVPSAVPLLRVAAVDDAEGHVVALDAEGRVRVFLAESGAETGATEPLLGGTPGAAGAGGTEEAEDPGSEPPAGVSLTVDGQRAYLSDPVAGVVHEIAYAGEVRVARTLETPTEPRFVAEVGR
ncbi:ABC transporter [Leucobacter massiliensis]|nr:ABC transporter [Leucobacter massiliensis]